MSKPRTWELSLIVGALVIIGYFGYGLLVAMPYRLIYFDWDLDGTTFVVPPLESSLTPADFPDVSAEHPGIGSVQEGDLLLSVDGASVRFDDFIFRFTWPRDQYRYDLERDGERYSATVQSQPADLADVFARWSVFIIAIAMWALATLALLKGQHRHRQKTRFFAVVFFGLAILFVADRGIRINWPLTLTTTSILVPVLAVAYLHIGLMVGEIRGRAISGVLAILYLLAATMGIATVQGAWLASTEFLAGLDQYFTWSLNSYLALGISFVLMPLVLIIRGLTAKGHLRQKSLIVGILCAIPGIPEFLFDILPFYLGLGAIYRDAILFLFILVPVAFFFVILRHQFLSLDRLLSRSTVFILLIGVVVVIFAVLDLVSSSISTRDLMLAFVLILIGVGGIWLLGLRNSLVADTVIFGAAARSDELRRDLTRSLGNASSFEAISNTMLEKVCSVLGVEQGAVFALQGDGQWTIVQSVGIQQPEDTSRIVFADRDISLAQTDASSPLWTALSWAKACIAIRNTKGPVAFVLYGEKKFDTEGFNSREVDLLLDVARLSAVAWENVRLLEMQEISRKRLFQRRIADQMRLASDLHDGPIQLVESAHMSLQRIVVPDRNQFAGAANILGSAEALQEALTGMRRILTSLRPKILGEDTEIIVNQLLSEFERRNPGIVISRTFEQINRGSWPDLDDLSKDAIFYVVRGALRNIEKHAAATTVEVTIRENQSLFRVDVKDNGVGLPIRGSLNRQETQRNGFDSLTSFFDYAELAGGRLEINSRTSTGGTLVTISVPVLSNHASATLALAVDPA